MVTIKTFIGDLEVTSLYEEGKRYPAHYAVTGEGLSRRTWHLTAEEYKALKKARVKLSE